MATEKEKNLQQVPFRLHVNDHRALKSKLALEAGKLNMQTLVEACILAYLDGDEHIRSVAREHKKLNTISKKTASWSRREQDRLLDEIEDMEAGD